ncbi:MAG: peptidase S10 [Bryobacteraceae bacterium]|nr:peptidase S10 [Bryobacteraceae bacterium]MDW8378234.1 peptidase S10 [Bryobacterales bacterium]
MYSLSILLGAGLWLTSVSLGQRLGVNPQTPIPTAPAQPDTPTVRKQELKLGNRLLRYTTTTGFLPIKNESGETEASVFYIAYTLDSTSGTAKRPLMFSFNGGPGSSSVWLHLGALGPYRAKLLPDGGLPPPPYELAPNEHTWLDMTDLVFIDPVGTGYSRATKPELARKYNGLQGDLAGVGEFIRLYLTRYGRWSSPLFLIGESYGTTRAAGLSGYLIDRGIAFNGILLISTVLNFQTIRFTKGNDLPYVLYLPSYTATAWYHKKLAPDLQTDLRKTLDQARQFALGPYATALAKGDAIPPSERQQVASQLARLTGLSVRYVEDSDLRIEIMRFTKELLRDRRLVAGRLDSRLTGWDGNNVAERQEFDPSLAAIRPPYTATLNDYVRQRLGYETDLNYFILGGGIASWDWGSAESGFADVSEQLRVALSRNPHMKVFVASGYYDLATPFFAAEYSLRHLGVDASAKKNFTLSEYEAGHMMYIHEPSLEKLRRDAGTFLEAALRR